MVAFIAVDQPCAALAVEALRLAHRSFGTFVDDLRPQIYPGEVVASCGESGSGKSQTVLACRQLVSKLPTGKFASAKSIGCNDAVFERPAHPYTRVLIAASLREENGLAAADDTH